MTLDLLGSKRFSASTCQMRATSAEGVARIADGTYLGMAHEQWDAAMAHADEGERQARDADRDVPVVVCGSGLA